MRSSLALGLVVMALASGCLGGGGAAQPAQPQAATGPPPGPKLTRFHARGFVFTYPAAWHHRPGFITSLTSGLVDLSTQPMVNPCRKRTDGFGCSWPVAHLRPGGLVVRWTEYWMVVPSHLPRPGVHLQVTRPGYCSQAGADETMRAEIVTQSRQELWVDACLRAPGLAQAQATVGAMLRSLRSTPVTVAVDGSIRSNGGLRGTTRPIAGAQIRFVGTRRSITVRADGHGEFLLSALPGVYHVVIIGHAPTANGRFLAPIPQIITIGSRGHPIRLFVSIK